MPLTSEQLEQSERAQAQKLYSNLRAVDLFGPQSSGMLAAEVLRRHPARYRALKLEWRYETKELRRPDHE